MKCCARLFTRTPSQGAVVPLFKCLSPSPPPHGDLAAPRSPLRASHLLSRVCPQLFQPASPPRSYVHPPPFGTPSTHLTFPTPSRVAHQPQLDGDEIISRHLASLYDMLLQARASPKRQPPSPCAAVLSRLSLARTRAHVVPSPHPPPPPPPPYLLSTLPLTPSSSPFPTHSF
jgi:hypothetical protein